jgi:hypothetical protein
VKCKSEFDRLISLADYSMQTAKQVAENKWVIWEVLEASAA